MLMMMIHSSSTGSRSSRKVGSSIETGAAERSELVPVIAAREDTTKTEYDDEKQGSSQGKTQRWPRHMVNGHGCWGRQIRALHCYLSLSLCLCFLLLRIVLLALLLSLLLSCDV